jgi:hypothetical protein
MKKIEDQANVLEITFSDIDSVECSRIYELCKSSIAIPATLASNRQRRAGQLT